MYYSYRDVAHLNITYSALQSVLRILQAQKGASAPQQLPWFPLGSTVYCSCWLWGLNCFDRSGHTATAAYTYNSLSELKVTR